MKSFALYNTGLAQKCEKYCFIPNHAISNQKQRFFFWEIIHNFTTASFMQGWKQPWFNDVIFLPFSDHCIPLLFLSELLMFISLVPKIRFSLENIILTSPAWTKIKWSTKMVLRMKSGALMFHFKKGKLNTIYVCFFHFFSMLTLISSHKLTDICRHHGVAMVING